MIKSNKIDDEREEQGLPSFSLFFFFFLPSASPHDPSLSPRGQETDGTLCLARGAVRGTNFYDRHLRKKSYLLVWT